MAGHGMGHGERNEGIMAAALSGAGFDYANAAEKTECPAPSGEWRLYIAY
jgi:hypothetical protein